MDKNKLKKLIDEFEDTCNNKETYCFAKEFLLHSIGQDPRTFIQIKLIEKYKFELSRDAGKDIGWDGTFTEWIKNGFAKKFAEVYHEDKNITQLYKEIKNGKDD
jgi:hypothetical protein